MKSVNDFKSEYLILSCLHLTYLDIGGWTTGMHFKKDEGQHFQVTW